MESYYAQGLRDAGLDPDEMDWADSPAEPPSEAAEVAKLRSERDAALAELARLQQLVSPSAPAAPSPVAQSPASALPVHAAAQPVRSVVLTPETGAPHIGHPPVGHAIASSLPAPVAAIQPNANAGHVAPISAPARSSDLGRLTDAPCMATSAPGGTVEPIASNALTASAQAFFRLPSPAVPKFNGDESQTVSDWIADIKDLTQLSGVGEQKAWHLQSHNCLGLPSRYGAMLTSLLQLHLLL